MSADNWTTCPRCERIAAEKEAKRLKDLAASYGKVSAEEYDRLKSLKPIEAPEDTLRENYEQGICKWTKRGNGLEFGSIYRASCDECGFEYEFEEYRAVKA